MKYVKILGLLAVAAGALTAFAGTASATLTSPAGTNYNGNLVATSTNTVLDGSVNISCGHSVSEGPVNNGATEGEITNLTFTECGNTTVQVNSKGSLRIESLGKNTGTLFSTGAEVTVQTHSFFLGTTHCIYKTNNTHIGTVRGTGHKENANTGAKLSIDSAPIPQVATDGLCGSDAEWTGTYVVSTPAHLIID